MAQGGYQRPSRPAPVSGPGALSRRTDGGGAGQGQQRLANAAYGEQKAFSEIQAGAPMARAQRPPMPQVTPIGAPTMRPDEPITAGAPVGPGPGTEVLGLKTTADTQLADMNKLSRYLPLMEKYATSPASSGTLKSFVRYLRSQSQ